MGLKTIKMEWDLCSSPPWVTILPLHHVSEPYIKKSQTFHISVDFDWEKSIEMA